MKVSFIGLGIMGSRMAANLLKNGTELTVYNRSKEPVVALVEKGARGAASLAEAVAEADVVFSMLSTPEVVRECFLSEQGALTHMKADAIWVDCTTVNPSFSLQAREQARQHGIRFLDAPVAGTKPHAERAELTFFVGAGPGEVDSLRPLLEQMGRKVLELGEAGKGAAFKMLVNMLLAQSMVLFSEAVLMGQKLGLDKNFLLDILPSLVVTAPFTKFKAEMIRSNDYEGQFPLEWMHKDLHLAALTAYEVGQPLFLANLAKELYASACEQGMGRLDFAAIHQYLEGR
ncbi:MAG: NAD(P)-dependent oxidoreductase [Bacteroidota bacterium]